MRQVQSPNAHREGDTADCRTFRVMNSYRNDNGHIAGEREYLETDDDDCANDRDAELYDNSPLPNVGYTTAVCSCRSVFLVYETSTPHYRHIRTLFKVRARKTGARSASGGECF